MALDVNTPVGVPSGWEEMVAVLNTCPRMFSVYRPWNRTFPARDYDLFVHDWRVEE